MKNILLKGVCSLLLLCLSACLGDPATQLTMANQAGVVAINETGEKMIYVKGGDVISSADFQSANVENGECILFDYAIDYGAAENLAEKETEWLTATIYSTTITEVGHWMLHSQLTDTTGVVPGDMLLTSFQSRFAYIRNNLFLFTEISNHKTAQVDSFSLSYEPTDPYDQNGVYNLYLRAVCLDQGDAEGTGTRMIIPCAFDISQFVAKAEQRGMEELNFRINYPVAFGKDSTRVSWKASDTFTIDLAH